MDGAKTHTMARGNGVSPEMDGCINGIREKDECGRKGMKDWKMRICRGFPSSSAACAVWSFQSITRAVLPLCTSGGGEWERDAEVRLMKWMSFKVLGERRGSGVVVRGAGHQNFTNSKRFLDKITNCLINLWLVHQRCWCWCHGAFWAHRTRPRPSCRRSRPPGYRLGLHAGRRGGFCSGRVWSEGTGALLRLETHKSSWIHLTTNSLCGKWSEVEWSSGWWSMKRKKGGWTYKIFIVCLQRKASWATVSAVPHMLASSSELSPQSSLPSQTHVWSLHKVLLQMNSSARQKNAPAVTRKNRTSAQTTV